jgi:ribA/ribD-fused uncharacterized protein
MTLASVLQPFNGNYSALFLSGMNLRYNPRGYWELSRQPITSQNRESLFSDLIHHLSISDLTNIPHVDNLISRINNVWQSNSKFQRTPNRGGSIYFNSRVQGYEFLSNFCPTLMVHEGMLFRCSESLYQFLFLKSKGVDADLFELSKMDGITAKKFANRFKKDDASWESEGALKIMRFVLEKKFGANPILQKALIDTYPHHLVESTDSSFWGCGADDTGRNSLGWLLEERRRAFL